MGRAINVNSDELVKYARKLELASKKALPRAISNTLNSMAFDVKKRTLLAETEASFTNRNRTFFKRFSRVQMSRPGKIETMQAIVGMVSNGEQAGFDQTQQQQGGKIRGRTFVPLDSARVSGDNKRNVRPRFRIKNLTIHVDTAEARASDVKQRFVQSAVYALERFGDSANLKHQRDDGKTFIYNVKRGGRDIKTRKFNIKVTPLYSVKEGRAVSIRNPKPFTLRASIKTQREKANKFFKKSAEREFKKIMR